MTDKDVADYFVQLMVASKNFTPKDATGIMRLAQIVGKQDFINSHAWTFKQKTEILTTTAGTETVDLPSDFDGIISLIERTSTHGNKLLELPTDEYDRNIPYSTSLTNDTPKYYKVDYEANYGIWRLYLYPTPSAAISLYLSYLSSSVEGVPEKFMPAYMACIAKYIVLPGSPEHMSATNTANMEIDRMILVDTPSHSEVSKILEEEEATQPRNYKWYEDQ